MYKKQNRGQTLGGTSGFIADDDNEEESLGPTFSISQVCEQLPLVLSLSVYLSVCLSIYLPACLSVCLSACLCLPLSLCDLFIQLFVIDSWRQF
jgi:hypothetical protein